MKYLSGEKISENVEYIELGDGYLSVHTLVKMHQAVHKNLCIL